MPAIKYLQAFILLTVLSISSHKAVHAQASLDNIQIEGGTISGTIADAVHIFKGIPFAAAPTGDLRWKAPQPVIPWSGVKQCDKFSASPMQASPAPFSMWSEEFLIPKEPIGEDCLYLNVWTGAKSASEKRAVLVWIYGGGFASGGSACPIYDGSAMAKKGIVFVSINYRVGVFGFLAHPELTKESSSHSSGNYGLMDQVAALQWVQKNIEQFGGDPANVTIAGQSAGSMSVNCLVASPLAKNLFNKAIAESGASFTNGSAVLQDAEAGGVKIMQALQLNSIAEMRAMPADELQKKAQGVRGPIVDGYVLPDHINKIFEQHKENKVLLLTGWNEDEGLLFGPMKNAADFKKAASTNYGANAATFLKYYPAGNDAEASASQLKLSRDQIFGTQNYKWATIQSANGSKVYVYRFTRKPPATGEYKKFGAFHTAEVPYAYDNLQFVHRPWEAVDRQLATTMSAYWINFIKTGNPNGKGLPVWQAYDNEKSLIMVLGEQPQTKPIWDKEALEFLLHE